MHIMPFSLLLLLFQNVVKLILQRGAKINSVYYCDHILKKGLLPDIRHLSNDDFMFQQDGAPAHRKSQKRR